MANVGKGNKDTLYIANPEMLRFKVQGVGGSGGERIGQNTEEFVQQKPVMGLMPLFHWEPGTYTWQLH